MKRQVFGGIAPVLLLGGIVALAEKAKDEPKPKEDNKQKEFKFHNATFASQHEFVVALGRRCGTKPPSVAQRKSIHEKTVNFQKNNANLADALGEVTVPVHFHVI